MRQVGRVAIRLFRGRGNVTCPSSLSRPFESKDAITIGLFLPWNKNFIPASCENVRGKSLFLSKLEIINIVILLR